MEKIDVCFLVDVYFVFYLMIDCLLFREVVLIIKYFFEIRNVNWVVIFLIVIKKDFKYG